MKTSRKLTALLLAVLLVIGILSMTACGNTSWSAKYGDTTIPGGAYPLSVMLAYQNVCSTYGPVALTQEIEMADGSVTTIGTYVNDAAKENLENYIATKAMFEKLGLSYSDEDYSEYMALYGDYYSAQSEIYKKNGISKSTFEELVIINTLRSNALDEYYTAQYVDSASDLYLSDGDIQKYFDENYLRFNYMMYYAVDSEGKYLTEDSDAYKAELQKLTDITNKQLSFDEYVKTAKAYTDIAAYKEGGTMDAVDLDAALADVGMGDVYYSISTLDIGKSGVYTFSFYDESYNTCHAICAAQRIAPEQSGKDYLDSKDEIISSICYDNLNAELDEYYNGLGVTLNDRVIKTFAAEKIDLSTFTSIVPSN